jgi:hypothetical protein
VADPAFHDMAHSAALDTSAPVLEVVRETVSNLDGLMLGVIRRINTINDCFWAVNREVTMQLDHGVSRVKQLRPVHLDFVVILSARGSCVQNRAQECQRKNAAASKAAPEWKTKSTAQDRHAPWMSETSRGRLKERSILGNGEAELNETQHFFVRDAAAMRCWYLIDQSDSQPTIEDFDGTVSGENDFPRSWRWQLVHLHSGCGSPGIDLTGLI